MKTWHRIWLGIILGMVLVPAMSGCKTAPSAANSDSPKLQGLDQHELQEFWHRQQGSQFIPYKWFLALPRVDTNSRQLQPGAYFHFKDDMVDRYRFVSNPDANAEDNPDDLPIGFVRTIIKEKPYGEKEWLGFTCAWCHTARLRYTDSRGEHVIPIEGGPAMQNNLAFGLDSLTALGVTVRDRERFVAFLGEVLGKRTEDLTDEEISDYSRRVVSFLTERAGKMLTTAHSKGVNLFPVPWGFGRQDALGRGANFVLMRVDPDNIQPANAPVSFPHLWNAPLYDWVQWNGSIEHRDARNIAQTIGVGAGLFEDFFLEADNFKPWKLKLLDWLVPQSWKRRIVECKAWFTSVNLESLQRLEELVDKLTPPDWPSAFPSIEDGPAKNAAMLGKKAYGIWCAHCHVPTWRPYDPAEPNVGRFEVTMIPIEEVGTDPLAASNFHFRKIRLGPLKKVYDYIGDDMNDVIHAAKGEDTSMISAAKGIELMTTKLFELHGKEKVAPHGQRGSNEWRAPLAYMARPHVGIWATAPFLHNGSVPSLQKLLGPPSERPRRFCVASEKFDPQAVGFKVDECRPNETPVDTTLPGNSNMGHEVWLKTASFCEPYKPKDDGSAPVKKFPPGVVACLDKDQQDKEHIIEYLKTCDLDLMELHPQTLKRVPRHWKDIKDLPPMLFCKRDERKMRERGEL